MVAPTTRLDARFYLQATRRRLVVVAGLNAASLHAAIDLETASGRLVVIRIKVAGFDVIFDFHKCFSNFDVDDEQRRRNLGGIAHGGDNRRIFACAPSGACRPNGGVATRLSSIRFLEETNIVCGPGSEWLHICFC